MRKHIKLAKLPIHYETDESIEQAKVILSERVKKSKIMQIKLRFIGVPR